jgi:hypothetical protein
LPQDPVRRRVDPLTAIDRIQLLATEFTIETESDAVRRRIREVAPFPRQSAAILHRRALGVRSVGGEFRIDAATEGEDFELTAFFAAENLLRRMHREALAALPDPVRLRAATARHAGRTFLIVGPQRSGKTTLALALLFDGDDVSGDELVLLHDGQATAFPWRFRVNETSVALLPPLRTLPAVVARNGASARDWWFAVDPTDFGFSWEITPAAVSSVFYLEPNHGGRSQVIEVGKLDMARRLLAQATAPPSNRRGWIGEITRMLNEARTYVVQLGDPAPAAIAMKAFL